MKITDRKHIAIILYVGQRGKVYEKTILDKLKGVNFRDIIKCSKIVHEQNIHLLKETLDITDPHKEWKYGWQLTILGKRLRRQLVKDGWYLADA